MRGPLRHPLTAAARTECASLAREGDEPVQSAVGAVEPREPARQEATLEEVPKRPLDKWQQTVAVA